MDAPVDLEVISDERIGAGGFLALRRLRLRNRRADGTRSREYACDLLERPRGVDAVAVALYARGPDGVRVLVRDCLRPALLFGRPRPEPPWCVEVVAGLVEQGDAGEDGLRARAAAEAFEEAGVRLDPAAVAPLGPPRYASPGVLGERLFFVMAEADPAASVDPPGDGSPLEEGGRPRWLPIDEAIARVGDAKSEVALRRLRDRLAGAAATR